jgi:proton-translocating NADH-quinone oxidoreductase chain L
MMSDWQGWLYVAAVLIPLGAFAIQALGERWLGRLNASIATGAIGTSCVLSLLGLLFFLPHFWGGSSHPEPAAEPSAATHDEAHPAGSSHHEPFAWKGSFDWVSVGPMGIEGDTFEGPTHYLPKLAIPLGIHIDGLAVLMFAMVTFVATLIHVYSIGYMSGDKRYPRFFTYLSLFCFSMLGLVAASNVFMVFIFWELVGICSYLLIGFWYEDKANCDAANKAFIVNRVGDVGMLVGLGILWSVFGTFTIADLNRGLADPALRDELHRMTYETATHGSQAGDVTISVADSVHGGAAESKTLPYWLLCIAGLGIFAGCVGKSAQFPLHVWLPDAMAGPTPVSALIHAATMVAAGVYLVGRFYPLFTHEVLLYIAYTGAITLFIGASIALVQIDYKKVLAYSTVSQLGFMMLALGVGGWAAGLFHLLTHAFFKALLFLGAGSVYHSVHTYDLFKLGGLRHKMPRTALTMLAGTLAISGVPLFSGFYSKDAILASAVKFVAEYPGHFLLLALPAIGAFMTAFYMFRMWFLIFDDRPGHTAKTAAHNEKHTFAAHAEHAHEHMHDDPVAHAHESPPVMVWPLILLAIPAVVIGYPLLILPIGTPILEGMLETAEPLPAISIELWQKLTAMLGSIAIALGGIGLAAAMYSHRRVLSAETFATGFKGLHRFLTHKWHFDDLYNLIFVRPTLGLARMLRGFDLGVVDGVVNGAASLVERTSRVGGAIDRYVVDGAVNAFGWIIYGVGYLSRAIQTGSIRTYVAILTVAVVGLFFFVYRWIQ